MKTHRSPRRLSFLLLAALISSSLVAKATEATQTGQTAQADQQQKTKRKIDLRVMPKGTEISHDEFIDRIGAPPLITDAADAADEGVKKVAIFFTSDKASDGSTSTEMPHVAYSMGVGHHTEIGIEAPFVQNQAADGTKISGVGKQSIGVKTAVYENEKTGLNVAVAGSYSSDVPFTNSAAKGVTELGNHLAAKFLVSKQFGAIITVANAGYDHLLNPQAGVANPDQLSLSVAAGVRYNPRTAFMTEVAQTNSTAGFNRDVTRIVNLGVIHKYNKNITVFASLGKSLGAAADGLTHTYALAGLSYEWDGDGDGRAFLRKHHMWKLDDNDGEKESENGESQN